MTKFLPFYLDSSGFMQNDKSFMITGECLYFLTAMLNSSLFKYCFLENFPELQGGTRELRKVFLDKIPIIKVSKEINEDFKELVQKIQDLRSKEVDTIRLEMLVDEKIFNLYALDENERKEIGFITIT